MLYKALLIVQPKKSARAPELISQDAAWYECPKYTLVVPNPENLDSLIFFKAIEKLLKKSGDTKEYNCQSSYKSSLAIMERKVSYSRKPKGVLVDRGVIKIEYSFKEKTKNFIKHEARIKDASRELVEKLFE